MCAAYWQIYVAASFVCCRMLMTNLPPTACFTLLGIFRQSSRQRWSRGHKARGEGQRHKKIRGHGQRQPFRGHKGVARIFDWGRPKPQITCNDVIRNFQKRNFLWGKYIVEWKIWSCSLLALNQDFGKGRRRKHYSSTPIIRTPIIRNACYPNTTSTKVIRSITTTLANLKQTKWGFL